MTYEKKRLRNEEIVKYRQTHSLFQTALKFDLSTNQIFRIQKKWKQQNAVLGQP